MKNKSVQLDLFGFKETEENRIHHLAVKQDKLRKSFMVRYNLVIEQLEEMQMEIDYLKSKQKEKYEHNDFSSDPGLRAVVHL